MARNVSEDLICDVCGTGSRVTSYTIVDPDGATIVDLCAGDAKPLAALKAAGSKEPRRKAASTRRASGHAVVPVD